MISTRLLTRLAAAALPVLAAIPAAAQSAAGRPIELGIDGTLGVTFADEFTTVGLTAPVSRMRLGFFMSDAVSFEPSVAFGIQRVSHEVGGEERSSSTYTSLAADFGLLFHLGTPGAASGGAPAVAFRPYVRPFAGLNMSTSDNESFGNRSATQFRVGAGVGTRRRLGERLALRLEGLVAHHLGEDAFGPSTTIGLNVGLSFFAR